MGDTGSQAWKHTKERNKISQNTCVMQASALSMSEDDV